MENITNNEDNVFLQDEEIYGKKIQPTSVEKHTVNDIDLKNTFYDNIIEAAQSSQVDIGSINSLAQDAQNRNDMYNIYDAMGEDGTIGAVLETYAEDATETNDSGNIVWVESSDTKITSMVNFLLDSLNVNKNMFKWTFSLCKYGNVYFRLYRNSEYNDDLLFEDNDKKKTLNEDIKIKAYSKNDKYANYMEMVTNPATMFELTRFGKTIAYIEAPVINTVVKNTNTTYNTFNFNYKFNKKDINIYPPTEFVHAALEDDVLREDETVDIFNTQKDYDEDKNALNYKVRKGQSLLANIYTVWRQLQLLENSVLLNRVTKSSIIRAINVEVGDMPKENVSKTLLGIKQMIEQKSAIKVGDSMTDYTNPGPIENTIYIPQHKGVGAITTSQIGGDVDVKSLIDLEYYLNKMYGQLRVPKQFFCLRGDTPILLLNGETKTLRYLFENKNNYIGKGILSCSPEGTISPTKIKDIMLTRKGASFIRVHLDNGKFVDVTPDHRMMLRDGSFVEAQELHINDSLMPYYDKITKDRRYILDNKSGKWKLQYRVVAEHIYDEDELKDKQVHHIDHNKFNDDIDNLIPLSGRDHMYEHLDQFHKSNKENGKIRRQMGIDHGNKNKFSVTNGIENRWLNKGETIPEGFYPGQTCNYSAEVRQGMAERLRERRKGQGSWLKGLNKETDERVRNLTEKSAQTRRERTALGLYDETFKKHSEFCKEHETWRARHEAHLKTIPENRRNTDHYVRCVYCGAIHKIKCNEDWYKEYLNMDKLWYCCKDCYKFDGRGKLSRSYKLYLESNSDLEQYAYNRLHNDKYRSDFFFLTETLAEKLDIIDTYTPECNHKVVGIEWLDVCEDAYDIEVESDNHTFALPCGIFVHNCQTDDSTGFNGGTSLSIISSRYAKMIKRIQNTMIQAITDAINLMLIDRGLDSYVNKFTLHMLNPTTQEEIDRRENISGKIQLTNDIMGMLDGMIEDNKSKIKVLKSLLSNILDNSEITEVLDAELEKLEEEEDEQPDETEDIEETEESGELNFNDEFASELGGEETEETSEEEGSEEAILPTPDQLDVDLNNI